MLEISINTKKELFYALSKEVDLLGQNFQYDFDWVNHFLGKIWDLEMMPSEDPRFDNAYQDIVQHIVSNYDWDVEYLYFTRLKLLGDTNKFIKLLETIITPDIISQEDEIMKLVILINRFLEKENYKLVINAYNSNGTPVYKIKHKDDAQYYNDLPQNSIKFYVKSIPKNLADKSYFILQFNSGWNDYSNKTEFHLLFNNEDINESIGNVKITDGKSKNTSITIPNEFNELSDNFCSLGQDIEYYKNLKKICGNNFESVLYALKDVAFFPEIHDKFEQNAIFNSSLIRYNSIERLLREVRYRIYGYDLKNLYSFKYFFNPKYSTVEDNLTIDFKFNNSDASLNRIYALIGKNGTGKTQFITQLPLDIAQNNNDSFSPKTPLFSKIITVSYSTFDSFEIPQKTSMFNYVYCGLFNKNRKLLTPEEQEMRFHKTWRNIEVLGRMKEWKRVLLNFIDADLINQLIVKKSRFKIAVSIEGFKKIKDLLSSGQSIILFVLTEIVSNIRYDSLLLFDEPETHLHPNAISQLINTIYELVTEFQSFCILTTHSPIVIQQLFSKNVYVIEKHENNLPSVRKIGVESFGENLTVLTEEVFGTKEVGHQYKAILLKLVKDGKSYEEINTILTSNETQLSLNARLYLKSILNK